MSRPSKNRRELMGALNAAMRDASGQGVLFSQAVAQRLGINSTDLECLDLLARGPLAAGALAELTGLTTGAITGVVDRLEQAGFARRERDKEDRRRVLVHATRAVAERIVPLFAPMERHAMAALSPYRDEELALLLDFLKRAHKAALAAMAEFNELGLSATKAKPREPS